MDIKLYASCSGNALYALLKCDVLFVPVERPLYEIIGRQVIFDSLNSHIPIERSWKYFEYECEKQERRYFKNLDSK